MRVTSDDILQGPLGPTLYRMIKPSVIGHLFLMSFAAVDTFFIGLMGSEELAAILRFLSLLEKLSVSTEYAMPVVLVPRASYYVLSSPS